jgi:hypothetical protein
MKTILANKKIKPIYMSTNIDIKNCKTCEYHTNDKCLYYHVALGEYVFDLYTQIDYQIFATEKDAMTIDIARNDTRFCGPDAIHYRLKK